MNTIDFSMVGGYPLTENDLEFLQNNANDSIRALAGIGNADNYIIKGVEVSGDDPTFTFTPGWIYYRGEVYYCPGGDADGSSFSDIGFEITELADADRELVYSDGVVRMPLSSKTAIPIHFSAADNDTQFGYSGLKRGRVPYDVPPDPVWDVYSTSSTANSDLAAVTVNTVLRARMNLIDRTIQVGIQVTVLSATSIGVSPPILRAVDTGIRLPWTVSGCGTHVPVFYIPVCNQISGSTFPSQADSSGAPLDYITCQVIGDQVWVGIKKTYGLPINYEASGSFVTVENMAW